MFYFNANLRWMLIGALEIRWCAQYTPAQAKKMQQVLAQPGVVEKFVQGLDHGAAVRSVSQHTHRPLRFGVDGGVNGGVRPGAGL